MTVAASSILDRARTQLIDAGATRWTDAELLKWLSDGQRTIVAAVPAASATRATVALAAGTRQTLPADGYQLLKVERNNVNDGGTPGRAVRIVSRELLDSFDPDWHSATSKAIAQNYVFDPNTPTTYFVSPPNTGAGYVDITYSKLPPELAAAADNIAVEDIYQTALVDYVLYRAYQKDADFAPGAAMAAGYLQLFMAAIGQTETGRVAANVNAEMAPADLSQRSTAK